MRQDGKHQQNESVVHDGDQQPYSYRGAQAAQSILALDGNRCCDCGEDASEDYSSNHECAEPCPGRCVESVQNERHGKSDDERDRQRERETEVETAESLAAIDGLREDQLDELTCVVEIDGAEDDGDERNDEEHDAHEAELRLDRVTAEAQQRIGHHEE